MPIYLSSQGGVVKKCLCSERVVPVHYVAIDDLVITTPLKKRYNRPLVISVRARCRRFTAEPLHG